MRVSALGCCLIDYLYGDGSFSHQVFKAFSSTRADDGGLRSGGLVFAEDLETHTGLSFDQILAELLREGAQPTVNIGGPAIISLIHIAQILADRGHQYEFLGSAGTDQQYDLLTEYIRQTSIDATFTRSEKLHTPSTYVFNDSSAQNGKGERSFVNLLGSALAFTEEDVDKKFYTTDLLILGGTALVPNLHKDLDVVLKKAKEGGAITVVGTIFDFLNEKRNPDGRWPFYGYQWVDLLVCDALEALRMSGCATLDAAARWLSTSGVGALIITHGANEILAWSNQESIFGFNELTHYPVCSYVDDLIASDPSLRGDTTGCGDNFLGGVVASILMQLEDRERTSLDLSNTILWGGASGGMTLMQEGGMFHQEYAGQKMEKLLPIVDHYRSQLSQSLEADSSSQ